jgi:NADH-quinone oxidoreductase subunit L
MIDLARLIPALPFAGFLILVLSGKRLSVRAAGAIGAGAVGLSMAASLSVLWGYVRVPPRGAGYVLTLGTWFSTDGLSPAFGLWLDGLSLIMASVISLVAFLIHLYSTAFMRNDRESTDPEQGYRRFFAYMNLFVGSMLTLVLADNLLFLYLGWEGVGLCSYLLIGFWYREPENASAAVKAFIMTRIGDTALVSGLFLLFATLGTLDIQEAGRRAAELWTPGSAVATCAALLFLAGAVGKSAQLPLQTWLPDAMAGPTPVSALIHAATMVTAGVYLIARMHVFFDLAPVVRLLVGAIGAATLVLSSVSAIVQRDIKRVLAYSTISQVGYMFLALGVGAWAAAIFHFMTHAFFKALLFLSAGVVIQALDNEHDIFKMGGLRKSLPVVFWTFLIGAASLSAIPFVTAGFYSKELILSLVRHEGPAGTWLWAAGLVGAFLTPLYAFRVVFVAFFGRGREVTRRPGAAMVPPLVVLAVFSLGGWLLAPTLRAHPAALAFLPAAIMPGGESVWSTPSMRAGFSLLAFIVPLPGLAAAGLLYLARPAWATALRALPGADAVHALWFSGWGFDWLYRVLFVRPFERFTLVNRDDAIDLASRGLAGIASFWSRAAVLTQPGKVRWYVAGVALGAAVYGGMVILL